MVKLLNSRLEKFAKLKKVLNTEQSRYGYVYISHMPDGFEEPGLRKFFSQFGKILRVKVSRSKKTGRSRNYGFIEFEDPEVAKVAAQTMHGFLLFGKQLVCKFLPEVHRFTMFPSKRKIHPTYPDFLERYNAEEDQLKVKARVSRFLEKEQQLRDRISSLGINYEFPGYQALVS